MGWYIYTNNKRYKHPPGPSAFPFIGNMFLLDPLKPHITLTSWQKKYGDVFRISHFGNDVIVVSGYEAIKTVLISDSTTYAGRPYLFREEVLNGFRPGFSLADYSESLMRTKKTVMTAMKMHGDGLAFLEAVSLEVIQGLIQELQDLEQQPFDPFPLLRKSVVNIMSTMVG